MKTALLALGFVLALAMAPLSSACAPTTHPADVQATINGTTYYAAIDCVPLECTGIQLPWAWVYRESNGIAGLQRSDAFAGDQACGHPDTLLL